tara:strand:- start:1406 stop:2020 length:615 start_codon:yes stop_codon:yes gene_type:complete
MTDDSPKHPFHILRHDEYKNSVEQKGKFDYLSWAVCWDKLKEIDPNARYELVQVIDTGQSKMVHVQLHYEVDGNELVHNEYLAVRDFRNQAVSNPDAAQVENTFRRAVAKAVSMATGFGLDLWINEDIRDLDYVPNSINGEMPVKGGITPEQRVKLDRLSRSNYLSPQGKKRVTQIMNDANTTQEDADLRIKEINAIIKERKEK